MAGQGKRIHAWSGKLQVGMETTDQIGFFGKTPASRASAYTLSNYTATRSLSGAASAASPVAKALCTVIYDLQQYGLLQ